jgi:hypothetical protein
MNGASCIGRDHFTVNFDLVGGWSIGALESTNRVYECFTWTLNDEF